MRSSTGQHWIALDHVRALAALMVFTWHFTHSTDGYPVALAGAPAIFPLAILDEGHTGVALFMTLSGYLFAKLLDRRAIRYRWFFWNRFVRLVPLMVLAILVAALDRYLRTGDDILVTSFATVLRGFVAPFWPFAPLANGLWSLVVETHFYLVLPILMAATRRNAWMPLIVAGAMIAIRVESSLVAGGVRNLAYWTIFGHIDQFLLGIFAFQHRHLVRGRHQVAAAVAIAFALAIYAFDMAGGWYGLDDHGWHGVVWAVLPGVEGAAYALLIAWYETSFMPSGRGLSGSVGKAGAYSYSIYLFHFFVVFRMARFIDTRVMDLSNFYVACLWAALCFAALVPFAALSFRWIEAPFLALRRPYERPLPDPADRAIGALTPVTPG